MGYVLLQGVFPVLSLPLYLLLMVVELLGEILWELLALILTCLCCQIRCLVQCLHSLGYQVALDFSGIDCGTYLYGFSCPCMIIMHV